MLSGLYFIRTLLSYTNTTKPLQLSIYSDSLSLIQRISDHCEYSHYFPNTTTSADWNIIQSIVSIIISLPGVGTLHHVKGHQDKNTPFYDFALEVQMNVDANHLASDFDTTNSNITRICTTPLWLQRQHTF